MPRKRAALIPALALAASVVSISPSQAADHLEAPLVQADGRTDINDLYAFQSPEDPSKTVLVMTVNPGFGGQSYISTMEPKIREVRNMIRNAGLDDVVDLEVDGGIGPNTIAGAAKAGANVLIAGSALFKEPKGLKHAVTQLRAAATAAFTA